jgi:hypothetical protein
MSKSQNTATYAMAVFLIPLVILMAMSSCSTFRGEKKAQAQASEGKKKTKIRKCRLESCHVRMIHLHEGVEYFGKNHWFLKAWWYTGKNPKIGEGFGKMRRDPHQDKMRNSRRKK